jgi:hypothetical protein
VPSGDGHRMHWVAVEVLVLVRELFAHLWCQRVRQLFSQGRPVHPQQAMPGPTYHLGHV